MMKKLIALLLALVMVFSVATLFAGCDDSGSKKSSSSRYDDDDEEEEEEEEEKDEDDKKDSDDKDEDDSKNDDDKDKDEDEPTEPEPTAVDVDELEDDDLVYVMIYNPQIYDETARSDRSKLSTGYIGNQIEVDSNRGDGLEGEENPYSFLSQDERNSVIPWDQLNFDGDRAGGLGAVYEEGDEENFFYDYGNGSARESEFTCVYEGKYCYVWSDGSGDESAILDYAEEFDDEIYEDVTETFGDPDMIDETGKINIMFHPMYSGLLGYFWFYELCTEAQLDRATAEQYGINLNHAMIHINADFTHDSRHATSVKGTLAHEFQHLIVGTDVFETVNETQYGTWLNEAMSGWIEEQLYPGTKEDNGHYRSFMESDRIRQGQSMYNFGTDRFDIGVYGSVYFFAEYLAMEAGDDVFSDIHDYWRTSYSDTLCDAEAIYKSVPKSLIKTLDDIIIYSKNVDFDSEEEEFMSKLILSFYLEAVNEDSTAKNFDEIDASYLLYDSLDDATIEGGGRIIVAVKDGSFEIPDDADDGLVYVGLDKDFNVITPIVSK